MEKSEKNKRILFLIQGSGRSIYYESFVLELKKRGYFVVIGLMCPSGPIQDYFEQKGFVCENYNIPRSPLLTYYFKHIRFWKAVLKKHNIKLVFSHLQWANSVALMLNATSFSKINIIPTRHHIDASYLFNSKKRKTEDFIINLLAKKQVVVSMHAHDFMLKNEWFAKKSKIYFIALGYDFDLYKGLESDLSVKIRSEFPAKLLILTAARLVRTKRHSLSISAMKILLDKGLDVKLIVLDDGPERGAIIEQISKLGLSNKVYLLGNKTNISDYLKAADILLQPSIEESSNQVFKEAAYYGKTSIITSGVGDFDEYAVNLKNAFCINRETTAEDLAEVLESIYSGEHDLSAMATELRRVVISKFDIEKTVNEYIKLSNN